MELQVRGTHQVEQMLQLWGIWWPGEALRRTGEALIEDTRLRLEDDTTASDGTQWEPWSDNPPGRGYASTRGPGHKLLYGEGDLAESIDANVRGDTMEAGSPLDYALAQQFGYDARNLPARPYMGVSRELRAALDTIYESDFDGGWLALRA